MAIAALVISIIALGASFWGAWEATLRPARLKLAFSFVGVGRAGSNRTVVLVVPVSITNAGARGETIIDAALIERGKKGIALFASWVTLKQGTIPTFFKPKKAEASTAIESTKSPFGIAPHSETLKILVFQPYNTQPQLTDDVTLEYELVLRGTRRNWRAHNHVHWLKGTTANVAGGAPVLTEVAEGIVWRHNLLRECGIDTSKMAGTLGVYDFG
jgi:hypothetical protein